MPHEWKTYRVGVNSPRLENSSAVLVGSDLDPTHTIANHDPSGSGRRVAMLNTDGRVVIAPEQAKSVLHHRAHESPDGRWIWVDGSCCAQQALLLSRQGNEVRTVVPPAPPGVGIGFGGWDREGLLLYWAIDAGHSTLVAVDVGGSERYRISTPSEFGAVSAGVVGAAPDRSWQIIELSGGMGSTFRARRLLVDRDLRVLPHPLDDPRYNLFMLRDEIVYFDESGTAHAYDPRSERLRDLPLRLDLSLVPAMIGVSDGYFVWMELTRGYVADLETGRRAPLPLRTPSTSIVEGARLAEYHFHDNAIEIFDLAASTKQ